MSSNSSPLHSVALHEDRLRRLAPLDIASPQRLQQIAHLPRQHFELHRDAVETMNRIPDIFPGFAFLKIINRSMLRLLTFLPQAIRPRSIDFDVAIPAMTEHFRQRQCFHDSNHDHTQRYESLNELLTPDKDIAELDPAADVKLGSMVMSKVDYAKFSTMAKSWHKLDPAGAFAQLAALRNGRHIVKFRVTPE